MQLWICLIQMEVLSTSVSIFNVYLIMANQRIFQVVIFFFHFFILTCLAYGGAYPLENESEQIQYSRSNPLDYIESNRKREYERQYQVQSSGTGVRKIDGQCKKEGILCKPQFDVNLDLKCSTNESQEIFDILVPLRFKEVEIDIVDKSMNGINGHFPIKGRSGPNGELSFSIDYLANENLKFVLRRNKKEIILSVADASRSIVLPTGFCAN